MKKGETLATIARKLRVSRADLAEANNLSSSRGVRAGQELVIPRAPATLLAASTERAAPTAVASRAISGSRRRVGAPSSRPRAQIVTTRSSAATRCSSIARLFDTTVAKIKSLEPAAQQPHRARRSAEDRSQPTAQR